MTDMQDLEREERARKRIAALGLDATFELRACDWFEPTPQDAKGFGEAAAPLSLLEEAAANPRLDRRTSPGLNRLGVDVSEMSPCRYVLFGEGFRALTEVSDEAFVVESDRILVDSRKVTVPCVVVTTGNRRLVMDAGPKHRLEVDLATPQVEAWVEDLGDPWLFDAVERARSRPGVLAELTAVGLLYRHRVRTTEEVRAQASALRAGNSTDRELEWVRRQAPKDLEELEERAVVRAEELRERLRAVCKEPDPEDRSWESEFSELLHDREKLEGVRILLRAASSASRLDSALAVLDEEGDVWVRALPEPPRLSEGELLTRVALLDHDAWWAHPAALGELPEE